jgi:hypothetical protein
MVDALTPSTVTTVNAIGVQTFCSGLWLSSNSKFSFPTSRVASITVSSPSNHANYVTNERRGRPAERDLTICDTYDTHKQ